MAAFVGAFSFNVVTETRGLDRDGDFSDWRQVVNVVAWLVNLLVMLLELCALVKAMHLSILMPGLALRGPEGSMTRALSVMRIEYRRVHGFFCAGLLALLVPVALYSITAFPSVPVSLLLGAVVAVAICLLACQFKQLRRQLFNRGRHEDFSV